MNNSLQIENLSMIFGKRDPVHALNNVNVSFPDCTISGLLGNNGAGKTTLIKCLVGLLTPNQGIIKMSSAPKVLDSNTRRKIISVVLDGGRNLFWYMTVRENIRYFLMLRKQPYDILMNIIARTHKNIIDRSVKSDREMLVIRLLLFKIQEYIIGRCIFHTTHAVIVQNDYRLISHKSLKMEDLAGGQLKMPKLSIETFARILKIS